MNSNLFIYDNAKQITQKATFIIFDISQASLCCSFIEQNVSNGYVLDIDKQRILRSIISGLVFGYTVQGEIISLAICEISGPEMANQLYGINDVFFDTMILSFVATSKIYRNQGIAKNLISTIFQTPLFTISQSFLSFCHPKNNNAIKLLHTQPFFRIIGARIINGRLRYIFLKKKHDRHLFCEFIRLNITDVYEITKNLSKGFVSVSLFSDENETVVWLAR